MDDHTGIRRPLLADDHHAGAGAGAHARAPPRPDRDRDGDDDEAGRGGDDGDGGGGGDGGPPRELTNLAPLDAPLAQAPAGARRPSWLDAPAIETRYYGAMRARGRRRGCPPTAVAATVIAAYCLALLPLLALEVSFVAAALLLAPFLLPLQLLVQMCWCESALTTPRRVAFCVGGMRADHAVAHRAATMYWCRPVALESMLRDGAFIDLASLDDPATVAAIAMGAAPRLGLTATVLAQDHASSPQTAGSVRDHRLAIIRAVLAVYPRLNAPSWLVLASKAAADRCSEGLDALLRCKPADVTVRELGILLSTAAIHGDAHMVQQLLNAGADVNAHSRGSGLTPLMAAQRNLWHRLAVTRVLLAQPGLDINAVDHNGWTALHHACAATEPALSVMWLEHSAGGLLDTEADEAHIDAEELPLARRPPRSSCSPMMRLCCSRYAKQSLVLRWSPCASRLQRALRPAPPPCVSGEAVAMLLSHPRMVPNASIDPARRSALFYARPAALRALLADPRVDTLVAPALRGATPLHDIVVTVTNVPWGHHMRERAALMVSRWPQWLVSSMDAGHIPLTITMWSMMRKAPVTAALRDGVAVDVNSAAEAAAAGALVVHEWGSAMDDDELLSWLCDAPADVTLRNTQGFPFMAALWRVASPAVTMGYPPPAPTAMARFLAAVGGSAWRRRRIAIVAWLVIRHR